MRRKKIVYTEWEKGGKEELRRKVHWRIY